jgi:hypothetical protein
VWIRQVNRLQMQPYLQLMLQRATIDFDSVSQCSTFVLWR